MSLRDLAVLSYACLLPALAQDRMPFIPLDKLTPEQQKSVELLKAKRLAEAQRRVPGARTGTPFINCPFVVLLRTPVLMNSMLSVTDALETTNSLPQKLIEMTIILTARQLTAQYPWNSHYPLALKAGLKREIADAIAAGRRPEGMAEDEDVVYTFVAELLQNKSLGDPTYERVVGKYGEKGVIDTIGLVGYYSTLAMMMNVARSATQPDSTAPKLTPFPR
jgi:4-carboxymuconolactone decarboxylase